MTLLNLLGSTTPTTNETTVYGILYISYLKHIENCIIEEIPWKFHDNDTFHDETLVKTQLPLKSYGFLWLFHRCFQRFSPVNPGDPRSSLESWHGTASEIKLLKASGTEM